MTKLRPGLPVLPAAMRTLPVDHRGYPVPWFVQWFLADGSATEPGVGQPDFRVADGRKRNAAIAHRLCWVCGKRLGPRFAFTIGPMCAVNRVAGDPPAHVACAIFSAQACPFLSRPGAERRDANLPKGGTVPGEGIMRNPGVALVWICESYKVVPDGKGSWLMDIGPPRGILWFAEGRQATAAEVAASVESGLPILRKVAAEEGPDATAQLEVQIARARELLPT